MTGGVQRFTTCSNPRCEAILIPQPQWNAKSRAERRAATADGMRRQGVGSLCHPCAMKARRS